MENSKELFYAGIDIGSTTVKLTVSDKDGKLLFGEYKRHLAHTKDTLIELLKKAHKQLGDITLSVHITGSGAISISKSLQLPFVQEVVAVATALKTYYPQTDVAVELGGEDAKIIYFTGGLEERMNGVCAGGTGSFIDQMAGLLQTDAPGLNELAKSSTEVYPIASRCGVFAKTDIQPLINDGAKRPDIAESIFMAVVNQTISGLACGNPIRGNVAFLGGPLHFLTELKRCFVKTLKLTPEQVIDPDNSHLFAALGAGMSRENEAPVGIVELISRLENDTKTEYETKRLEPLFESQKEYEEFLSRHNKAKVGKRDLSTYSGRCFLGIDAGSTTTKLALISEDGELLWSFYDNNHGNPIKTATGAMAELHKLMPESAYIARSCSTGYGEQLLKNAFNLEDGEVETIAHATGAEFFDPETDCILDIGGQDMKCIRLKEGIVDSIMLNEACSSGCGSFLENFATSLNLTAAEFAEKAITSKAPVDLGTRCTVFMNSNVKQAQKEGASVSDISAGLAYSVIKNAIYKVIRLADISDLGKHIVVQGGTFYNKAVLRAVEKISGLEVTCPDISGLMGAFGAALLARQRFDGTKSTILPFDEIENLEYKSTTMRCGGCENNCLLTVNTFSGGKKYVTGNRCEKKFGASGTAKGVDLFEYKMKRLFDYEPLPKDSAPRGVIGIPRVLNIYENYPLWATFFKELGFSVLVSPFSNRHIYSLGMESIPSESECYPAKLAHGHAQWLVDQGVKTIFHPSIYYEFKETEYAQNRYNCPMVVSYPENLKNNMESLEGIHFVHPFLSLISEEFAAKRLVQICKEEWNIPAKEVRAALHKAWAEQRRFKQDMINEGGKLLKKMEEDGSRGIVVAGRPYHLDPEINHGIPTMIASFGLNVFTEDSLPVPLEGKRNLRVLDQWTYHSRLYNAAEFVVKHRNLELVQLNSFGCGLDAVTTDQVKEILEKSDRIYTCLKIDEVNNLGAARIRIRSLLAAMNMNKEVCADKPAYDYGRAQFTKQMYDEGYTILLPQMSPIHFNMVEPVFRRFGYNAVLLSDATKNAVDIGLKYVNNDACYPSIIVVGQFMEAVLSGHYDVNKLAILITQTGGCCRASNYVGFIRRALDQAGLSQIPVISLNSGNGLETNPGFHVTLEMLKLGMESLVFGDLIMRCLYRVRPYELVPGSANELHDKWQKKCSDHLAGTDKTYTYKTLCQAIIKDFDEFPIDENLVKPRVGVVGEILVKFSPLANNYLVDLLEKEGAEAVVPDLIDFMGKYVYDRRYKYYELGAPFSKLIVSKIGVSGLNMLRKPVVEALEKSKRFNPPEDIRKIAKGASRFLSPSNQYGEGWFLCGEMVELLEEEVYSIVCIQPFGCLPNHVVGKGVIKALKKAYPKANIAAVDYDPGASEVNQLNRIKLMLAAAKDL